MHMVRRYQDIGWLFTDYERANLPSADSLPKNAATTIPTIGQLFVPDEIVERYVCYLEDVQLWTVTAFDYRATASLVYRGLETPGPAWKDLNGSDWDVRLSIVFSEKGGISSAIGRYQVSTGYPRLTVV